MKSIDSTNYLSLDLELNQDENSQITDIIQIGISIGNINNGILFTSSWFVKPSNPLTDRISELTGITESDFENAVSLQKVAINIEDIINKYQVHINPVIWGFDDASRLKLEFEKNKVFFPFFGRQRIDVKQLFAFIEIVNGRSAKGNLKNSMARFKLKFKGREHRADNDAENTLLFFFELIKRQRRMEEGIQMIKELKI